jgi:hypothetical protein
MATNSLETFADEVTSVWGPLSSDVVEACRRRMEILLKAPATEDWLAALLNDGPTSRELYRAPSKGFVLLAHMEPTGLFRPPHDHGRAWVIYGVVRGESEMGTYSRTVTADGKIKLVKRNTTLLRPGQVQVYLPGDIHDTRCISGPALLLRFTERDLKKEDQVDHMVTPYAEEDHNWVHEAN